ncbi:hypothetical protein J6590_024552 [Homalodisca vitripennis]|nr:hypothetical protein J6590_024552 [Homalodisca vitripennis]
MTEVVRLTTVCNPSLSGARSERFTNDGGGAPHYGTVTMNHHRQPLVTPDFLARRDWAFIKSSVREVVIGRTQSHEDRYI